MVKVSDWLLWKQKVADVDIHDGLFQNIKNVKVNE